MMLINKHLKGTDFSLPGHQTGILLFHGATATTAEVRPLAEHLNQAGYTVCAPLLPGHGTTVNHLSQIYWQQLTHCAEKAYQQLAKTCTTIVVGGESVGALLAYYLAHKHPNINAILAYSPAISLGHSPWEWLLIHLLWPFITAVKKKKFKHDHQWQGYDQKPLKLAIELHKLQKHVRANAHTITQPSLLVYARGDQTVSVPAIEKFIPLLAQPPQVLALNLNEHTVILGKQQTMIFEQTLHFMQALDNH